MTDAELEQLADETFEEVSELIRCMRPAQARQLILATLQSHRRRHVQPGETMSAELNYHEALHLIKAEPNSEEACLLVDKLVQSGQIRASTANGLLKWIRENL